jgi:hypothetical protein
MRWPIDGHHVCRRHGAGSVYAQQKAAETLERRRWEHALKLELAEIDPVYLEQHPLEALLEEVARSAQAVRWLAEEVARLEVPDPFETGPLRDIVGMDEEGLPIVVQAHGKLYGAARDGSLGIHPLWSELNKERERHARLCKLALDAGVAERIVNLAEATGRMVADTVVGTLEEMGLPAAQVERAKRIIGRKMRELGTPGGLPPAIDVG